VAVILGVATLSSRAKFDTIPFGLPAGPPGGLPAGPPEALRGC